MRFGVPKIIECVDASAAFSRSTCPVWVVAVSCLELGWRHSQIVSYARFQFASCTFTSEYSQLASISARSAGYSEWRDAHTNIIFLKEGRCKATWKREFNLPWREAGQPDHHDDKVDSDQWAVNKELSLSAAAEDHRVRRCQRCLQPLNRGGLFFFFFFFTLVTGPRRSLSLKLSDTKVYEP